MRWRKSKLTQNHKQMSKQFTFETIGTHFWIEIFDELSTEELDTTKGRIEFLCSQFNNAYSRFKTDSQISILNRERVLHSPSKELQEILSFGKALFIRTHQTFNLLTGHILEARGYDAHYSFTPDPTASLANCNPLFDLTIDVDEISLTCGNIDIGGYGKGWLIDLIAKDLRAHNVHYFLVNGGGDMYATSNHEKPITIYLEHPTEVGKYLIETTLFNQGFAASSPFKRQWSDKDTTYTHIVSVSEFEEVATFVKARTVVDADAFATMAMLLPQDKLPYAAEIENLAVARFNPKTNELWQTQNFSMYN